MVRRLIRVVVRSTSESNSSQKVRKRGRNWFYISMTVMLGEAGGLQHLCPEGKELKQVGGGKMRPVELGGEGVVGPTPGGCRVKMKERRPQGKERRVVEMVTDP